MAKRLGVTGEDDTPPSDMPASERQTGYLLDMARFLLDEQMKVAERLDSKARNQAVVTAAYFAATLAAVLGILARQTLSPEWARALAIGSGASAFVLAMALIWTAYALNVQEESFVSEARMKSYSDHAYHGNPLIGRYIAETTLGVVEDRKKVNRDRSGRVKAAGVWCLISTTVTSAALMMLLIATALAA